MPLIEIRSDDDLARLSNEDVFLLNVCTLLEYFKKTRSRKAIGVLLVRYAYEARQGKRLHLSRIVEELGPPDCYMANGSVMDIYYSMGSGMMGTVRFENEILKWFGSSPMQQFEKCEKPHARAWTDLPGTCDVHP